MEVNQIVRERHFKWVNLDPFCMTSILPWLSMGQTTPWPDLDPTAQLLIILSMPSHNPKTNAKF